MNKLKIIGILGFMSFLFINILNMTEPKEEDLNLNSLFTMARASGEDPEPNGEICKEDDCQVVAGIPPYQVIYDGHYWHCGTGEPSDYCKRSECWVDCDAGPI
jgi:hypothetical protein